MSSHGINPIHKASSTAAAPAAREHASLDKMMASEKSTSPASASSNKTESLSEKLLSAILNKPQASREEIINLIENFGVNENGGQPLYETLSKQKYALAYCLNALRAEANPKNAGIEKTLDTVIKQLNTKDQLSKAIFDQMFNPKETIFGDVDVANGHLWDEEKKS